MALTEKENKKVKDYEKIYTTIMHEIEDRGKMRDKNGKALIIHTNLLPRYIVEAVEGSFSSPLIASRLPLINEAIKKEMKYYVGIKYTSKKTKYTLSSASKDSISNSSSSDSHYSFDFKKTKT